MKLVLMKKLASMIINLIQITQHIRAMQVNGFLLFGRKYNLIRNLQYLWEWSCCFNSIQYDF